jgi:hypothetical protein
VAIDILWKFEIFGRVGIGISAELLSSLRVTRLVEFFFCVTYSGKQGAPRAPSGVLGEALLRYVA